MTQEPDSVVAVQRARVWVWLAWLGLAAVVTAGYFRWEVDYFRSPGPVFRTLLLYALPVVAAAGAVYLWIRRRRLWRFEIPVLAAFCGLCLVLYQPVAGLIAAALFLACLASGCRVARLFRIPLATPAEMLTLGFGLGCAVLIPLLFVLGLLRLYYAPVFVVLLAVPCLVFWRDVLAGVRAVRQIMTATAGGGHPLAGIAFVFAVFAAVPALAVALAPSTAFDPLAMHLALARYYAAQHALTTIPALDYGYFPQGCEVLMALAWTLGGQSAAQLISPLFWILSLPLLFLIARACGLNKVAAFAGVVAAAMMPFFHWTGANAKNDLAMVFFQAAALLAFIRWLETRSRAWIFIGALFLGSTFAVKHVALFGAIPLVCFFLYASRRWRVALVFCLILIASAVYWHARAAYLTGNPVYPADLSEIWRAGRSHAKPAAHSKLARVLRVPWMAQFDGSRSFESPLPNPMGVILFVFLPLAILIPGPRIPARRTCLLFCGVYLAYWIPTVGILRYAILPISLLIVLMVGKAAVFYDGLNRRLLRATVAGAFAGALLFAAVGIAIVEVNAPMLMLFARRIGPDQYLDLALRTHRSLAWLSANHPRSRIYGIDNCSRAYAPDLTKFNCSMGQWDDAEPGLARYPSEYVVLPREQKPGRDAEPVSSDPYFTVWQLR